MLWLKVIFVTFKGYKDLSKGREPKYSTTFGINKLVLKVEALLKVREVPPNFGEEIPNFLKVILS